MYNNTAILKTLNNSKLSLKEKRRALIEDTKKYYTVDKTKACAIGRLLPQATIDTIYAQGRQNKIVSELYEIKNLSYLIKLDGKGIGEPFLVDLQAFHDTEENWNDNGISQAGLSDYERLIHNYCTSNE